MADKKNNGSKTTVNQQESLFANLQEQKAGSHKKFEKPGDGIGGVLQGVEVTESFDAETGAVNNLMKATFKEVDENGFPTESTITCTLPHNAMRFIADNNFQPGFYIYFELIEIKQVEGNRQIKEFDIKFDPAGCFTEEKPMSATAAIEFYNQKRQETRQRRLEAAKAKQLGAGSVGEQTEL